MFSGQGSQYYQMGKQLYEKNDRFRFWMNHCDHLARPYLNISLIDIIYNGPNKSEPFDRLLYTNPALLSVEYSLSQVLTEMGIKPDFLIGYSLGEIAASVISGIISLENGIKLVIDMARLIEEKTPKAEMLAIFDSPVIIEEFPEIFKKCWLTGKNFQTSFVLTGLSNDIEQIQFFLSKKGKIFQKLPVKFGFHTELINIVESDVKNLIRKIPINPIEIPIISSLNCGKSVNDINSDYYWDIIRRPVDFEITIQNTIKKSDFIFIDVGPSGTLATFVKYILSENNCSSSLQTMNQFGNDLNSIAKMQSVLSENI